MSVGKSILLGMLTFTLVSLGGFAVWAFGGNWFYKNVGEGGLYAASALVFVALAGLLMHPLIDGPSRIARFYKAFLPAFLIYAVIWSAAWFLLKGRPGEWAGSIAGAFAFAFVLKIMLKAKSELFAAAVILAAAHSAGYFAGSDFYSAQRKTAPLLAKLGWGACYGLGFGAGLGFAFSAFQRKTSGQTANASSA
jgi:hypothetical protein